MKGPPTGPIINNEPVGSTSRSSGTSKDSRTPEVVVLAGDDPRAVSSVIELSRASYRKMWQNLAWATGYNVLAIPLAAGVLAPVGFVLSPAVGAILMSASTIVVALNAQLLRRLDLDPAQI